MRDGSRAWRCTGALGPALTEPGDRLQLRLPPRALPAVRDADRHRPARPHGSQRARTQRPTADSAWPNFPADPSPPRGDHPWEPEPSPPTSTSRRSRCTPSGSSSQGSSTTCTAKTSARAIRWNPTARAFGRIKVHGWPAHPEPKTYRLRDGRVVMAPNFRVSRQTLGGAPRAGHLGAPLEPHRRSDARRGRAGLLRRPRRHRRHHRRGRRAHRAAARRAHLRGRRHHDPDPRGLPVIGADGAVAGIVCDLWVDRAEVLFRYLEVEVADGARQAQRAAADQLLAHRPQRGQGALDPGRTVRAGTDHPHPRRRDPARRGKDHGLLRRRHACTRPRPARSHCCDRRTTRRPSTSSRPHPACPRRCQQANSMLWQGAPDWRMLAREALHIRFIAIYFGVLLVWRGAGVLASGGTRGRRHLVDAVAAAAGRRCTRRLLLLIAWLMAPHHRLHDHRPARRDARRRRAEHHLQPAAVADRSGRPACAGARQRGHHSHAHRAPTVSPTCTCGRMSGPGASSAPSRCCAALPQAASVAATLASALADSANQPAIAARGVDPPRQTTSQCVGPARRWPPDRSSLQANRTPIMSHHHAAQAGFPVAPLVAVGSLLLAIVAGSRLRSLHGLRHGQAGRRARRCRYANSASKTDPTAASSCSTRQRQRLVDTVAPGTNGFLRGTMRGLARERKRQGVEPAAAVSHDRPRRRQADARRSGHRAPRRPRLVRADQRRGVRPHHGSHGAGLPRRIDNTTGHHWTPHDHARTKARPACHRCGQSQHQPVDQRRVAGHGADAALLHHRLRGDGPDRRRADPRRSGTR